MSAYLLIHVPLKSQILSEWRHSEHSRAEEQQQRPWPLASRAPPILCPWRRGRNVGEGVLKTGKDTCPDKGTSVPAMVSGTALHSRFYGNQLRSPLGRAFVQLGPPWPSSQHEDWSNGGQGSSVSHDSSFMPPVRLHWPLKYPLLSDHNHPLGSLWNLLSPFGPWKAVDTISGEFLIIKTQLVASSTFLPSLP